MVIPVRRATRTRPLVILTGLILTLAILSSPGKCAGGENGERNESRELHCATNRKTRLKRDGGLSVVAT